jgi:two-component system invasion response regulator UvrY
MQRSESAVPIRVLLADDYRGLHAAVARLLDPLCEIVGNVTNVSDLLSETMRLQPDVVLLDLRMAGTSGLEACRQLRDAVPTAKVVLYSASDEPDLGDRALAAGASDFVAKARIHIDLLPAIQRVAAGR